MTLDGSQFLAASQKLLAVNQQLEAALIRIRTQFTALIATLAPTQSSLSQTALALGGLTDGGATRGVATLASALALVAQKAADAGDALATARSNAQGMGDAVDQNEDVNKSEAETPAAPEPAGHAGSALATAVGAAAGTHELTEESKKLEHELHEVSNKEKEAGESAKHMKEEVRDAGLGFRGLGESASKAGELIRDAFLAVPEIAALVAVFAGVGEMVKKVRESFEYGDQLNALSRQTGETAETIAALRRTFEYFDVSADEVGHTLFMLQRSLGGISESGDSTVAAFSRIGLSIQDLKRMNAAEQFAAIQKGLATLPTQADRANVAMQIFGRSALEVQSILNADPADFAESMRAAQEYASVVGKSANMFEDIERKFFIFREQIDTVFARISVALAPAISNILDLVNKVDFTRWGKSIQEVIGIIVQAFSQGQVFALLELGLTISFKNAVNTFYKLFAAAVAGVGAGAGSLPKILKDGLGFLIDQRFWGGIAQVYAGEMIMQTQAIGDQLMIVFGGVKDILISSFTAAWSVGKPLFEDMAWSMKHPIETIIATLTNGLSLLIDAFGPLGAKIGASLGKATGNISDLFKGIGPAGSDLAAQSTAYLSQIMSQLVAAGVITVGNAADSWIDPEGLVTSGKQNIRAATAPVGDVPKDIITMIQDKFSAALAAFKGGNLLDSSKDVADAKAIIAKLRAGIPVGSDPQSPAGPTASQMTGFNYKLPEGDRLAKLGLFLGSSAAAPGLSELRSIKDNTAGSLRALNALAGRFNLGGGLNTVAIPRYL
jgi:hypothetical protein